MATIDTDVAKARVRYLMGDVSTSTLTDDTLTSVLTLATTEYTDDDEYYCEVVYYTLLESLRHLIRVNQANAGLTGNQARRKEVRGKTTIEVEFSDSSDFISDGWAQMYKDYVAHPEYVCESLRPERVFGLLNIGGTRQDTYRATDRNRNSRSAWDTETKTKFNMDRTRRRHRNLGRSKTGFNY